MKYFDREVARPAPDDFARGCTHALAIKTYRLTIQLVGVQAGTRVSRAHV